MLFFEIVIACCSSALCSHCAQADLACLPYPALMALARAALAFIAGMPAVSLDPELALALFVAPTLLDAAYDSSPRDLGDNLVPDISLALGAVA